MTTNVLNIKKSPESNSKTIGIVGNGFVGSSIENGFQGHYEIKIFDVDEKRSTHTMLEVVQSDYIFVCLPTPMVDAEGGQCNLSIIKNFFRNASEIATNGIFIIKSTVPIGTTEELCKEYPELNIIHNPEFLTAVNAKEDFINADRHIVGGDETLTSQIAQLYETRFPETPVIPMQSSESECVKYFANCFLATKVMVFNEMKLLCNELDSVDYDNVAEGVISDRRIGNSHYSVPGPDGDYGFGGTCFPKDINALIYTMQNYGIDPLVLKSVWQQNKNHRKNWDWAENASAVKEL